MFISCEISSSLERSRCSSACQCKCHCSFFSCLSTLIPKMPPTGPPVFGGLWQYLIDPSLSMRCLELKLAILHLFFQSHHHLSGPLKFPTVLLSLSLQRSLRFLPAIDLSFSGLESVFDLCQALLRLGQLLPCSLGLNRQQLLRRSYPKRCYHTCPRCATISFFQNIAT